MTPCPECKEPPHYHSWCTLCAQLFMAGAHIDFEQSFRADYLTGHTLQFLADKYGISLGGAYNYRVRLGLPPRASRKPYGRRAHG